MTRADLEIANHALGLYINQWDDCPTNAEVITCLKHAYLRIHHYLVKTSKCSRQESRATGRVLLSQSMVPLSPGWLPCHKLPLQRHRLPCIHPDDVCHCAQLLQCNLEEDDIFSCASIHAPYEGETVKTIPPVSKRNNEK